MEQSGKNASYHLEYLNRRPQVLREDATDEDRLALDKAWSEHINGSSYSYKKEQVHSSSMGAISGGARRPLSPDNLPYDNGARSLRSLHEVGLRIRFRFASCNWLPSGFARNWRSAATSRLAEHAQRRHQAGNSRMWTCQLDIRSVLRERLDGFRGSPIAANSGFKYQQAKTTRKLAPSYKSAAHS